MCEEYAGYIDDLIEDELDEQAAQKVNLHIYACRDCASAFKTLKREKQIYARFLFDVEPANDFPAKFVAKLNTEANKIFPSGETASANTIWKTGIFNFFRLHPATACAALLFLFGALFGIWRYASIEINRENEIAAKPETNEFEAKIVEKSVDSSRNEENKKAESGNNTDYINKKSQNENKFTAGKNVRLTEKIIPVKKNVSPQKTIIKNQNIFSKDENKLSEDKLIRESLAKSLEEETYNQIEKVELLLRSFRNARSIEGSEFYDISYEKNQAEKLLERNVKLRRGAESYGTFYAEELLSRVEPYLLDISNLESRPMSEKVLDIKERVKNQNIIASLQIYK